MIPIKIAVDKRTDFLKARKIIIVNSLRYVNNSFRCNKRFDREVGALQNLENELSKQYDKKLAIKEIIKQILFNINIDKEGNLYLEEAKINDIRPDTLFRFITYGNLECRGSLIILKALDYARLKYAMGGY